MDEPVIAETTLDEGLPMTETVFEAPELIFDDHTWLQMGYMAFDHCSPRLPHCLDNPIPLPNGKLLKKKGGHYTLVNEYRGE